MKQRQQIRHAFYTIFSQKLKVVLHNNVRRLELCLRANGNTFKSWFLYYFKSTLSTLEKKRKLIKLAAIPCHFILSYPAFLKVTKTNTLTTTTTLPEWRQFVIRNYSIYFMDQELLGLQTSVMSSKLFKAIVNKIRVLMPIISSIFKK